MEAAGDMHNGSPPKQVAASHASKLPLNRRLSVVRAVREQTRSENRGERKQHQYLKIGLSTFPVHLKNDPDMFCPVLLAMKSLVALSSCNSECP